MDIAEGIVEKICGCGVDGKGEEECGYYFL